MVKTFVVGGVDLGDLFERRKKLFFCPENGGLNLHQIVVRTSKPGLVGRYYVYIHSDRLLVELPIFNETIFA